MRPYIPIPCLRARLLQRPFRSIPMSLVYACSDHTHSKRETHTSTCFRTQPSYHVLSPSLGCVCYSPSPTQKVTVNGSAITWDKECGNGNPQASRAAIRYSSVQGVAAERAVDVVFRRLSESASQIAGSRTYVRGVVSFQIE